MSNRRLACYFHPTKVIVIDDQQDYLDHLILKIGKEINIDSFMDAEKAVAFLKSQNKANLLFGSLLSSLKDREDIGGLERDDSNHVYTEINVFDIHKIIYSVDRFKRIAVVIVDYAMPKMDGLEVSEALEHMPLKFILLTGKAAPDTVIRAFNEGRIQRFVSKDSSHFEEELTTAIFELQQTQFQEISEPIIKNLSASPISCMGDPLFVEFFNKFYQKNDIVEYYLLNESGSYLLLDAKGYLSILAVKNEREMQEYSEIAFDHKELDIEVSDALKQREKLLFFFTAEDEQHVAGWVNYIYPAKKLKGQDNTYYYSHIIDISKYHIDKERIISYQDYLSSL